MAVLYSLAAITPDTEFGLSFYDYFTEEERLGSAQEAVDGGEVCAALRFGHGEDTMPPSVILEVADPYYDREDSAPIAATKSPVCRT